MRISVYPILLLLITALFIQNTCPRGFSGKSTVVATCSHCPQKQMHRTITDGDNFSVISQPETRLPMYVLDLPGIQPAFRLASLASPRPVIPNTYKDTDPDELLQPPSA